MDWIRTSLGIGTVAVASVIAVACGSEPPSTFGPGGDDRDGGSQTDTDGSFFGNGDGSTKDGASADELWAKDPPLPWCGPEAGAVPPVPPGGTLDCPGDKNREGCPCTEAGKTAACWPGARVNRNLGICKDGVTTCKQTGELTLGWGPCEGYQLPDKTATKGKAACKCFSEGEWKIPNVSPCILTSTQTNNGVTTTKMYGVSTLKSSQKCPSYGSGALSDPPPLPLESFSTDTLKVDCTGHFRLCFTLKAGKYAAPSPNDCVMTKQCVEGDYPKINEVTPFPDLPAWVSDNPTCVKQFNDTGGYAELSVKGKSWVCENIDDGLGNEFVFQRFNYCPIKCSNPNDTSDECKNCTNGASGQF